ncbi:MAG: ABC transporter ATP-binding protein [Bacteroidota bacterium]|nr:MAG: ABC transporter ATP-binding protein [Bacteroidota bacterium]
MIDVINLKKSYGEREAVKSLNFLIKDGEFYGLLGPNGAGKTTTISIMSTILDADAGDVVIDNYNIKKNPKKVKQVIGVVPQEIALYNELSAGENLKFWGGLYNVPESELKARMDELLKWFGLYDRRNDKVGSYSGGMKRRINIAAALLHRPKVLFMDEPTVGIDPQSRNCIYEVIEKLHRDGMTIVYTTHYMEEAERFCDRIGIIDEGRIIAEGTLDDLKKSMAIKEVISITFSKLSDTLVNELTSFWRDLKHQDDKILFYSNDIKTDLPKLVSKCNQLSADIANIEIQKTNLETIFLSLTGKQLRD